MKDRRHNIRWQINKQAKLKLEGGQAFIPCHVRDINLKGIQLALRMKLPQEAFLKLSIVLSDEITLDVEAWVAWHRRIDALNLYGLYFSKIKDADKEKIYKFVYQCFPDEATKRWWRELGISKGGDTMQDRRIFERFTVNFPLRFIELGMNRESQAQALDVSAKGIGLVTNREFSQGTPLEMWLDIPDRAEPLYTRAEVVWSNMFEPNRFRVGVELEKADLMGMARVLRA